MGGEEVRGSQREEGGSVEEEGGSMFVREVARGGGLVKEGWGLGGLLLG